MGVFNGYHIALDVTACIPLKRKLELRKLITSNDGVISFIVTKKCKLLVTLNDEEKARDSFKCQTALKFNIPVVESRYLFDCIRTGCLVNPDPYILLGNTRNQLLSSGVIAAPQGKMSATRKKKKFGFINLNTVKVWNPSDKNCPSFPEDNYEVAQSIQLIKSDKKLFFVAEIHVASSADQFRYRVFTHTGMLTSQSSDKELNPDSGKKECRFSNSADECLLIYSRICDLQTEAPVSFTKTREYLGRNIGSKKFQQMQLESLLNTEELKKEVCELVEHVWREALGELQEILSVSIKSIKNEQVDKAESVLLELKRSLDGDPIQQQDDKIRQLSDEFYAQLSHKVQHQTPIITKHLISRKQELCQLVRDVISVSEGTDWSRRCPSESKYRALRCHIKYLKADDPTYVHINQHVLTSQQEKSAIEVLSIFEVSRSVEELVFNEKMENKRLLFHSSHVHNFVGILSRGLLLPKVIVDDCGGIRTDVGMLGSGIYFADDASTSAKYSKPSNCKGSRLMLVNEVGLGKCLDLVKYRTELNAPPEGYDSVHGVKASDDVRSDFKDDEYAIYNTNQQRLQYLVEFKVSDDVLKVLDIDNRDKIAVDEGSVSLSKKKNADLVDLNDIQNVPDPMLKVKAGLLSDSSGEIPLTAVHVKARLVDLAAQVVVFQHYKNQSNSPIEAKYVFPLDEMAAVCGFEAFINDKHIIGEVKEKETAHREYREAISQGHGTYLMDQDEETPDVFTVSVGNLPPWCDVMIKITYVAELQMEGESISFRLPSCVAPWKKSAGLDTVTQSELETVKITENQIETSVQVAIEMPFKINKIECPTHRIRSKKTDTKAVVEMQKNQPINEGFHLLISLAEIHVPRMWVEQLPDNPDSRACMLTFYPEFEATVSDGFEVVFLLDLSNSMKGNSLLEAKKILLLSLLHLPESCFFNVFVFGTDYDELFPCCRARTSTNVRLAEKFVMNQEASLGNTEVIRPLSSLYLLSPEDGFRNLFLISDGHISNEKVSLEAVRLNCRHSRLFTFGVGSVANHHMLRSLATAGCGYYEYFNSKTKSKWETKVRNQLSKAAQPSLSSIQVDWQNFNNIGTPVQAPAEITVLFNGCRQVVYGFVPDCSQAILRAVIDNQEVSTMVSTSDLNITTGKILHQLTARAIIQDWSDGQLASERIEHEIVKKNRKNYIIKLSKEFSIITQFTSFVAVEKREKGELTSASKNFNELVQKDSVDVLDYMSWESINCRVHVKTFDHPSFMLDVDLSETFEQLKSRVSEFVSKPVNLYRSLSGISAAGEVSLWDHKMEEGATIYALDDDLNHLCGAGMLSLADSVERDDISQLFDLAKRKLDHPELDLKWESKDPAVALENKFEDLLPRYRDEMLMSKREREKTSLSFDSRSLSFESRSLGVGSARAPDVRRRRGRQKMGSTYGIMSKEKDDSMLEGLGSSISKDVTDFDLYEENLGSSISKDITGFDLDKESCELSEWRAYGQSLAELADDPSYFCSLPLDRLKFADEGSPMAICEDSDALATCAYYLEDSDTCAASKTEELQCSVDFEKMDLDSTNLPRLGRSISSDRSTLLWPPHSFVPPLKKQSKEEIKGEFGSEIVDYLSFCTEQPSGMAMYDMRIPELSGEAHYSTMALPASAVAESPRYAPTSPSYVPLWHNKEKLQTTALKQSLVQFDLQTSSNVQEVTSALESESSELSLIDFAPSPPSVTVKALQRPAVLSPPPPPPQIPCSLLPPLVEPSPAEQPLMPRDSPPLQLAQKRSVQRRMPPQPDISDGHYDDSSARTALLSPRFNLMSVGLTSSSGPVHDVDGPSSQQSNTSGTLSQSSVSEELPSEDPASVPLMPPRRAMGFMCLRSKAMKLEGKKDIDGGGKYGHECLPQELMPEDDASVPLMPSPKIMSSRGQLGRGGGGIYRHRRVLPSNDETDLSVSQPSQGDSICKVSAMSIYPRQSFVPASKKLTKEKDICRESECLDEDKIADNLTEDLASSGLVAYDIQLPELSDEAHHVTMALPASAEEELSCYASKILPVSAMAGTQYYSAVSPALAVEESSRYAPASLSYGQSEQGQVAAKKKPQMAKLKRSSRESLKQASRKEPAVTSALESSELSAIDFAPTPPSVRRCLRSSMPSHTPSPPPLPPQIPCALPPPLPLAKQMVQTWMPPHKDISDDCYDLSSAGNERPIPTQHWPLHGVEMCTEQISMALGSGKGNALSVDMLSSRRNAFRSGISSRGDEVPDWTSIKTKNKKTVFKARVFPEVTRTIGIEIFGWIMTPVFERHAKLPGVHLLYLTTCNDYQTSVRIKVYKGEHQLTSYNVLLGELELTGLESVQQGRVKIEVKCEIDSHGILTLTASSQASGLSSNLTVQAVEDDLSEEEMEASVRSAEETKPIVPLDIGALRAIGQAGSWNVCLYKEQQFTFSEGTLKNNLNISTGRISWTPEGWEQLLKHHHEVPETDSIYWELNEELGQLIGVDFKKFCHILAENGLLSLGVNAASDVRRLLANFLILFRIYESLGSEKVVFDNADLKNYLSIAESGEGYEEVPDEFNFLITKAARFCLNMNERQPLIYARLNLGRSWPEAALNLLGEGTQGNHLA